MAQAHLNVLGPAFFPLHQLGGAGAAAGDLPPGAKPGRNLLKFHLRPAAHAGLDASEVPMPLNVPAAQAALRSGVTPLM